MVCILYFLLNPHINDVVKKQLSSYTFWCNGNVPKFHQKISSYTLYVCGFSSCLSSKSYELIRIEMSTIFTNIDKKLFNNIINDPSHKLLHLLPSRYEETYNFRHLQTDMTKHFFRACV